jgi:surface antigen
MGKRTAARSIRARIKTATIAAVITLIGISWSLPEAAADPPPWAPAHGYRAKGKFKGKGKYKYKYKQGYSSAAPALPFGLASGTCNRDAIGAILGGVAGGAAGTQIGKGSGRTAAIIGGTVLGAILGGSIGRSMDQADQNCVGQVLEHMDDRRAARWRNPDNGGSYQVTPTRTYQREDGRYCREYTAQSSIGGRTQTTYGRACRQPDGSWQLIS